MAWPAPSHCLSQCWSIAGAKFRPFCLGLNVLGGQTLCYTNKWGAWDPNRVANGNFAVYISPSCNCRNFLRASACRQRIVGVISLRGFEPWSLGLRTFTAKQECHIFSELLAADDVEVEIDCVVGDPEFVTDVMSEVKLGGHVGGVDGYVGEICTEYKQRGSQKNKG